MAELGNVNKAYIKVSSKLTWLGGEQNNSVNRTAEAIETSDKQDDWRRFISGAKGVTVDMTVFADNTDEAQMEAMDALRNGAEVDWAVGKVGDSALTEGDYGKAIVTSVSDTNNFGAVATRNISLTATGEVQRA